MAHSTAATAAVEAAAEGVTGVKRDRLLCVCPPCLGAPDQAARWLP